jgi:hypothetical protein
MFPNMLRRFGTSRPDSGPLAPILLFDHEPATSFRGVLSSSLFETLCRVSMHIDTRAYAAIAAVAAHHGLLAAPRIARFRGKIGAVSPLPFRPANHCKFSSQRLHMPLPGGTFAFSGALFPAFYRAPPVSRSGGQPAHPGALDNRWRYAGAHCCRDRRTAESAVRRPAATAVCPAGCVRTNRPLLSLPRMYTSAEL